ncbi:thiamine phosphate synthase [Mangrovihabitans endophyticus]|uniref:Thiamine-phosphate synthase n=1 Tax=Mangrovihabitans endophyticus TaxID=1751298 RepID=A0A8J3BYL3_9ACTN|nr:thiamine phosphate synthase [Mangrovihabitans endophyticus]GGK92699.1 thiamine-phosphate synthase [Mangrovihabitans endophyticus]
MDRTFPCLHVITGHRPEETVRAVVAVAARLGATDRLAVQVRVDDDMCDREAFELTSRILGRCRPQGVLCLVNDRLDVALAAGADGAHVGAEDLPVAAARRVLGPAAVLGATCRTPAAARAARDCGATYVGVGPAYATATKTGLPDPIGPDGVAAVVRAVPDMPVVAIGGVTVERLPELVGCGVAVIGALRADPDGAAQRFLTALSRPLSRIA